MTIKARVRLLKFNRDLVRRGFAPIRWLRPAGGNRGPSWVRFNLRNERTGYASFGWFRPEKSLGFSAILRAIDKQKKGAKPMAPRRTTNRR